MDAETRLNRRLVFAAVALGVLGVVITTNRTARVRGARIVGADGGRSTVDGGNTLSSTSGRLSKVTVALDYTNGPRPQYVIIDVIGASSGGSATIEGEDDEAEVLLSGPLGDGPRIEITTSARVIGRLRTRRVVFEELFNHEDTKSTKI